MELSRSENLKITSALEPTSYEGVRCGNEMRMSRGVISNSKAGEKSHRLRTKQVVKKKVYVILSGAKNLKHVSPPAMTKPGGRSFGHLLRYVI